MEYAAILLLLKKRRRPRKTIDEGLKSVFPVVAAGAAGAPGAGNGDVNQSVQRPERKKVGGSSLLQCQLSVEHECRYVQCTTPYFSLLLTTLSIFLARLWRTRSLTLPAPAMVSPVCCPPTPRTSVRMKEVERREVRPAIFAT